MFTINFLKRDCKICNQILGFDCFDTKKGGLYGLRSECKECRNRKYMENQNENRAYRKQNYQQNRDYYLNYFKQRHTLYKEELNYIHRSLYKKNPEPFKVACKEYKQKYKDEIRLRKIFQRQALRDEVFTYLGKICVWCKENDYDCMEVDHVNNDGHKSKNKNGARTERMEHILEKLKNGDKGFQALCTNCNWIKQISGGVLPINRKNLYHE